jgi:PTH1 family peptidyl-tRNA hydrolase
MKIIAGLGNPGKQYEKTRHNMGFEVIDELSRQYGIDTDTEKFKGLIGKGVINGEKVILVKPLTFMNLSGECLQPLMNYYKVGVEDLVVIYDDICLEPGHLRIRAKGSAGGHNGMKSIIKCVGADTFARVRVGVGEKPKGWDLADWVLGHFDKELVPVVEESFKKAADATACLISEGVDAAMNRFNG